VQTVPPGTSASEAWELMRRRRIHYLVVTTGGEIVGVLSERGMASRLYLNAKRFVVICRSR
jgi:CBS domain-containing protein